MTFIPILRNHGKANPLEPRVRVYANPNNGGLVFSVTRPIIERIGWSLRDRIAVAFGIGADLGKASLTRVEKGGQQLSTHGSGKNLFSVAVSLPRMIGSIERADIMEALPRSSTCDFQIIDGQLIVTLPRPRVAAVTRVA